MLQIVLWLWASASSPALIPECTISRFVPMFDVFSRKRGFVVHEFEK